MQWRTALVCSLYSTCIMHNTSLPSRFGKLSNFTINAFKMPLINVVANIGWITLGGSDIKILNDNVLAIGAIRAVKDDDIVIIGTIGGAGEAFKAEIGYLDLGRTRIILATTIFGELADIAWIMRVDPNRDLDVLDYDTKICMSKSFSSCLLMAWNSALPHT